MDEKSNTSPYNNLCFVYYSNAQDFSYEQGNNLINAGAKLAYFYWDFYYKRTLAFAPTLSIEYAISDRISLGGAVAYSVVNYEPSDNDRIKHTIFAVFAKGSYHFATSKRFDHT